MEPEDSVTRYSDSNGKDRRRYNNGKGEHDDGVRNGSRNGSGTRNGHGIANGSDVANNGGTSNGNGSRKLNGLGHGVHRPLTPTLGWGAHRRFAVPTQPKSGKRRVPDAMITLRGYKAWAAKVKQSWEPET